MIIDNFTVVYALQSGKTTSSIYYVKKYLRKAERIVVPVTVRCVARRLEIPGNVVAD